MSTPAHRPRPRTALTTDAGSAASRACMPLAELPGPAPGTRRCAASRRPPAPTAQASGLPPNVEPCCPGCSTPSTGRATTGGDRHDAAAEGLAEQVHVGDHVLVLAGERVAGAAQAGLDLVGDHQDAVRGAELPEPGQVARRRHDHPGLALDRLEQHRDPVRARRPRRPARPGRRRAPTRNPGVYGPKSVAGVRVGGEADDRGGPAVEVARRTTMIRLVGRHALDRVAPLARDLDRGLDRLGAGVHRQHHVHAASSASSAQNGPSWSWWNARLVRVRRSELRVRRGDQARVRVAEVQRRVAGEQSR